MFYNFANKNFVIKKEMNKMELSYSIVNKCSDCNCDKYDY